MITKILSVILLCLFTNIATAQTITWYSFSTGFQRGHPHSNSGIGLGSIFGQPFVGTTNNSRDTIISGFAANPNTGFRETLTPVENHPDLELPTVYSLFQNYPNPFNPSTHITFSVPKTTYVTLKVYDVLGREVANLVDEMRVTGEYTVAWNAEGVTSGVYFYRIVAGDFIQMKKMVLIR